MDIPKIKKIPKVIHQIWYQGKNVISKKMQDDSNKIKNIHPDWKYMIWDDDTIKQYFNNNKNILDTYNKLEHLHQKVDFIRYCILYEIGGIYVDMDVTILKPFDEIVELYGDYECILSDINLNMIESYALCNNKKCINNGIIISQPKSNFMLDLINTIHKNNTCLYYDLNKSMCINRVTGPLLFTKIYNNYKDKQKIKILNWSYFEPCILNDLCDIKDNTILIHHHNTTWINQIFTMAGYYYFKYKLVFYLLLIIILMKLIHYIISYIKK